MAGHVRFGATTGGALVILGTLLLAVARSMSDSVATLFRLFPMPVLGAILFFGVSNSGHPPTETAPYAPTAS